MKPVDEVALRAHIYIHHRWPNFVLLISISPDNFVSLRNAVFVGGLTKLAEHLLVSPTSGCQLLKIGIGQQLLHPSHSPLGGRIRTPGVLTIGLHCPD